jgi:uncharacterized protein YcaQ
VQKSREKSHSVDKILDRIKKAYNIATDAELAEFFNVKANTISAWRRRNSMNFELMFTKCADEDINWLIYGENVHETSSTPENDISTNPQVKKPSEIWPDDPNLVEYEQKIEEIAHIIEHGPFSQGLKLRLVKSLLRMFDQELDELHKQSDPSHPVSDES